MIHPTALHELDHLTESSYCFNYFILHFHNYSVLLLPSSQFHALPSSLAGLHPSSLHQYARLPDSFIVLHMYYNLGPDGLCLREGLVTCFFGNCLFCSSPQCLPFTPGLIPILCGHVTMLPHLILAFLAPLSAMLYILYTCVFWLSILS